MNRPIFVGLGHDGLSATRYRDCRHLAGAIVGDGRRRADDEPRSEERGRPSPLNCHGKSSRWSLGCVFGKSTRSTILTENRFPGPSRGGSRICPFRRPSVAGHRSSRPTAHRRYATGQFGNNHLGDRNPRRPVRACRHHVEHILRLAARARLRARLPLRRDRWFPRDQPRGFPAEVSPLAKGGLGGWWSLSRRTFGVNSPSFQAHHPMTLPHKLGFRRQRISSCMSMMLAL